MRLRSTLGVLLSLATSACGSSDAPPQEQPAVLDVGADEGSVVVDAVVEDAPVDSFVMTDAAVEDARIDAEAATSACAVSVVDATLSPASPLNESLAYDSAGQPHVAYAVRVGTEHRTRYATRVGATWTTELVTEEAKSIDGLSITLVAGKPRVAVASGAASALVMERDGTWKTLVTLAGNSSGAGVVLASGTDSTGAYQLSALLTLAGNLQLRDLPAGYIDWVHGPLMTTPFDARALRLAPDRTIHYAYATTGATREIRLHTYSATSRSGPLPIMASPTAGAPIAIGPGATPDKDAFVYASGARWLYVEPGSAAETIREGDMGYGTPRILRSGGSVYAAVFSGADPATPFVHLMKRTSGTWTEIMATDASSAALGERAPGKISLLARRKFPTASPTASDVKLFECP